MLLLIILAAIFGVFTFNTGKKEYDRYDWDMDYVEKASDSVRVDELVSSEEINPTKLLMDFINGKH